jgi:hypothetical protein
MGSHSVWTLDSNALPTEQVIELLDFLELLQLAVLLFLLLKKVNV